MTLEQIAHALGTSIADPQLGSNIPSGYSIDSRTIQPGELFVAISGEKFDGHHFVDQALEAGALAAVVSHRVSIPDAKATRLIWVGDTLAALQELARQVLLDWNGPVIGIAGSVGKTTTKEMTALVLERAGRVLKTIGNFNNAYGLPLSILRMVSDGNRAKDFQFSVLEMGMNHPGELKALCRIARPTVGVVVSVQIEHMEFFENLDAIAAAEAEIVDSLPQDGVAVLNADDELVRAMRKRHTGSTLFFGLSDEAEIRALDVRDRGLLGTDFVLATPEGAEEGHLPLPGRHFLYNGLAAAAVGHYFGLRVHEIVAALKRAQPAKHRGELFRFKVGFTLIDDSYNSSPHALAEMVRMLGAVPEAKRRIVVAGEMLELGSQAPLLHRSSGAGIAEAAVDRLIGVRGWAKELIEGAIEAGMPADHTSFCESSEEAADFLVRELQPGDVVLVKGSRGVRTERVVERVLRDYELA
ncbi:MAG: UDP-N-acetylmuramoyl-tripeptide--D-alanyl-D-alanine ligase [Acidobacteriota bacterium]